MTRDELLALLNRCSYSFDPERAHAEADEAIMTYLNDPDILAAYEKITKWYA